MVALIYFPIINNVTLTKFNQVEVDHLLQLCGIGYVIWSYYGSLILAMSQSSGRKKMPRRSLENISKVSFMCL